MVGASAGPAGVATADGADAELVPEAFVALTLKVYATPFVNPATMHEGEDESYGYDKVQVLRPGFDVTVNDEIHVPPP